MSKFILHVCVLMYAMKKRLFVYSNSHNFSLARQKRQAELGMYMRRMINRYKKDLLIDTHKVKTVF